MGNKKQIIDVHNDCLQDQKSFAAYLEIQKPFHTHTLPVSTSKLWTLNI